MVLKDAQIPANGFEGPNKMERHPHKATGPSTSSGLASLGFSLSFVLELHQANATDLSWKPGAQAAEQPADNTVSELLLFLF